MSPRIQSAGGRDHLAFIDMPLGKAIELISDLVSSPLLVRQPDTIDALRVALMALQSALHLSLLRNGRSGITSHG